MKVHSFVVMPNLPPELEKLRELAMNLWYGWNWDAIQLFIRIDPELWTASYQNPIKLLGTVSQEKLIELSEDDSFIAHLDRVYDSFTRYMSSSAWFEKQYSGKKDVKIAYFSAEYGIRESLPIYSGGLGILAGDHLKSASDLGIPLVAIGLLYSHGYFKQLLNRDGWQEEKYPVNDWYNMPVTLEKGNDGNPIKVSVDFDGTTVYMQIWRVQVGRVPLYLLDTNVPENSPEQRVITGQLYGGDRDIRIQQEIVLGIGGVRALKALGIEPSVYHMNEGHSALLVLDRLRDLIEAHGLSYGEGSELVWASNVFTTHTAVGAGNEWFKPDLLKKYLGNFVTSLGMKWVDFLAMGRVNPEDQNSEFCLTVLALKMSARSNGVSRLHGEVTRNMWKGVWRGLNEDEIPITSITNGIHPHTWINHNLVDLLLTYLGPAYMDESWNFDLWDNIDNIPDMELWRVHQRRRDRLTSFIRKRLGQQLIRQGASTGDVKAADNVLDPHALTIGFARRFATYKRGALLFTDIDRLDKLVNNPEMPVQFVFAGKAHPRDTEGKNLIRSIVHHCKSERFRHSIVFLEDYDINMARYLVKGVDVWLNAPRRPLEASGTSGMKASINGALNVSSLDGWWDEGHSSDAGWAFGREELYEDYGEQDWIESHELYDILERDIVPRFYDREHNLPRDWISMMKESMKLIGKHFNTHRMLIEYVEKTYMPASTNYAELTKDSFSGARELCAWRERLIRQWSKIEIESVDAEMPPNMTVGCDLSVNAKILLGELMPDDISVELVTGTLGPDGSMLNSCAVPMTPVGEGDNGVYTFHTNIQCDASGLCGYSLRVLPHHKYLAHNKLPGLVILEK